jgi:uncharacterized membrane protein YhiD involved in acid resistance
MDDREVVVRLGLSILLGAMIGIERQWHHKAAGVKTHTLVCIGSAGFALVSILGLGPNSSPTQLAVGVVTGIGFIGGGVIMHRGQGIQGINTAATLWATASLGLCIGGGYYRLSFWLFLSVLVVQFALRWLDHWIDGRVSPVAGADNYRLVIRLEPGIEPEVRRVWSAAAVRLQVYPAACGEIRKSGSKVALEFRFGLARNTLTEALSDASEELSRLPGVSRVEWSRLDT